MELTFEIIQLIIHEQFPEYDNLIIKRIKESGHDHLSYHLGDYLSLRFPSANEYSSQVIKEYNYCTTLQKELALPITTPIKLGKPSVYFPFYFTINKWIDGETVTSTNVTDKKQFADDLANFLNKLHKCDIKNGPIPNKQNFYRGGSLAVYHEETMQAIKNCNDYDQKRCLELWMKGLKSNYTQKPVWIHGDLEIGNILVMNGTLVAVIDFGNMAIGDPACDYVMAWTYFDYSSRSIFFDTLNLDESTIDRARAWALWKAMISLNDSNRWETANKTMQEILNKG